MAEIDFIQILDGVTLALHSAFPTAHIHAEAVDQDLLPGDFNVIPINPRHTAAMGTRSRRTIVFDVIYYPTEAGGRTECLDIAHRLSEILGTVETAGGDKVHCFKMESTIEDGVLHCPVTYAYFGYTVPENTPMETLSFN